MIGLETAIRLAEKGLVPDLICRQGIRKLIRMRLREEDCGSDDQRQEKTNSLVDRLKSSSVAIHPDKANEQHYELPPGFFQRILGSQLKYSACHWPQGVSSLDEAEESALSITAQRAELEDGHTILELGCGWGSLSLWLARKFPSSQILSMSNSSLQRDFIRSRAAEGGLENLEVITSDINEFQVDRRFDRVVSIEMFEHVRNYEALFARIANWLKPEGKLFVHIFSHKRFAYPFETEGPANWMGRYFFTGGLMPSHDLLLHFQRELLLEKQWRWNGQHYANTAHAWIRRMYRHKQHILPILSDVYGKEEVTRWWVRWKLFFMACEELFGYNNGEEWGVSHYRFINVHRKRGRMVSSSRNRS